MSLLDDILAEKASQSVKCIIGKMLDNQTDEIRKELIEVFESEIPSNRVCSAVMKFRGIHITDTSLRKHRRGDCSCQVQA